MAATSGANHSSALSRPGPSSAAEPRALAASVSSRYRCTLRSTALRSMSSWRSQRSRTASCAAVRPPPSPSSSRYSLDPGRHVSRPASARRPCVNGTHILAATPCRSAATARLNRDRPAKVRTQGTRAWRSSARPARPRTAFACRCELSPGAPDQVPALPGGVAPGRGARGRAGRAPHGRVVRVRQQVGRRAAARRVVLRADLVVQQRQLRHQLVVRGQLRRQPLLPAAAPARAQPAPSAGASAARARAGVCQSRRRRRRRRCRALAAAGATRVARWRAARAGRAHPAVSGGSSSSGRCAGCALKGPANCGHARPAGAPAAAAAPQPHLPQRAAAARASSRVPSRPKASRSIDSGAPTSRPAPAPAAHQSLPFYFGEQRLRPAASALTLCARHHNRPALLRERSADRATRVGTAPAGTGAAVMLKLRS